ncbi:MAG: hypothetical protein A3E36_00890 [Candidatus Andersenbacteria bacterium RIFCSPHIGHO2_12_FULL_45_11b]|uniref:Uncharacterized protein n=1 Tax=Candidatus Andersenbacteria bacterium RIFCSPHIGHO2_12_FULL_45_11b TaxID=1797282 RepID=A0A1G1X809_9BACT|nr:MAG: hypothetical protein A3E36_00890 [Candidatus Andersenbacteria bacterium RIFCSPHIGHO2_12_FULL_45_11b]
MSLNTSINTPYLVLAGVVFIAIAFVFVVTQPQLDRISVLRHDITDNTTTLMEKQDFIRTLAIKVQQLQAQPEAEKQLSVVVPQTDMTQDVVRVVGQYGAQAGVGIQSISNNSSERQAQINASIARGDAAKTPSDLRILSFQVNTVSTYAQLQAFIKALEKSPRLIDVVHLSIKQIAQLPGQVSATLRVQAYSQQK